MVITACSKSDESFDAVNDSIAGKYKLLLFTIAFGLCPTFLVQLKV